MLKMSTFDLWSRASSAPYRGYLGTTHAATVVLQVGTHHAAKGDVVHCTTLPAYGGGCPSGTVTYPPTDSTA